MHDSGRKTEPQDIVCMYRVYTHQGLPKVMLVTSSIIIASIQDIELFFKLISFTAEKQHMDNQGAAVKLG